MKTFDPSKVIFFMNVMPDMDALAKDRYDIKVVSKESSDMSLVVVPPVSEEVLQVQDDEVEPRASNRARTRSRSAEPTGVGVGKNLNKGSGLVSPTLLMMILSSQRRSCPSLTSRFKLSLGFLLPCFPASYSSKRFILFPCLPYLILLSQLIQFDIYV